MDQSFAPAQIVLGAVIGFLPSLALFWLEGARAQEERVRASKISSLDAAVSRLNKLLDHATAVLASANSQIPATGVLPWDPAAYYAADLALIPDQESVRELVAIISQVVSGAVIVDRKATELRMATLFSTILTSAGARRAELAR